MASFIRFRRGRRGRVADSARCVVNYYVPKDYGHRIERTDHAVNKGCANPIWSPQLKTDDARRRTLKRSRNPAFRAGFQKRLYRRKQV